MPDTTFNVPCGEPAEEDQIDYQTKKRKRSIRKGTHSCWACKRRKEKCLFENDDICSGCLRRGTKCVSQRYDDTEAPLATTASSTAMVTATRLQRVEEMLLKLTSQAQNQNQSQSQSRHLHTETFTSLAPSPAPQATPSLVGAPASTTCSTPSTPVVASKVNLPIIDLTRVGRRQALSETLISALPCSQDIQLLRNASARLPVLSTNHITTSYATIRRDGFQPTDGILSEPPLITSDPVLVARYMLQMVIFLQEMQSNSYPELADLVEPVAILTERCANSAISLVTRQDDLLGSIESLECVILESIYQCNIGRLRLSWMAAQRAILLAQTMGLHLLEDKGSGCHSRDTIHCLDPNGTCVELPHIWFRINHYMLLLSRMLGLPPGAVDMTKSKGIPAPFNMATETPEAYLEQVYLYVMVHTLSRKSSNMSPPDIKTTQSLDREMQRAARAVPSQWWLPPNLAESAKNPQQLFWDSHRLVIQMLHHDLRTQLNVPFMLAREEVDRQHAEMARIACAHSSREILSRFILLRSFNHTASSCRFANVLGLMAAIALVLAHIGGSNRRPRSQSEDGFSFQVGSLLSHQVPGDRAMMEQALETMRRMGDTSSDPLSAQSAQVLQRLLDLEASNNLQVTDDAAYVSIDTQFENHTFSVPEDSERISIPYFGHMRIIRPNGNDVVPEIPAQKAPDAQNYEAVDLVDPFLLDLRNESWVSQNIDMTFLDAFLESTT